MLEEQQGAWCDLCGEKGQSSRVRAVMGHTVWGLVDHCKDFGFYFEEVKSY